MFDVVRFKKGIFNYHGITTHFLLTIFFVKQIEIRSNESFMIATELLHSDKFVTTFCGFDWWINGSHLVVNEIFIHAPKCYEWTPQQKRKNDN